MFNCTMQIGLSVLHPRNNGIISRLKRVFTGCVLDQLWVLPKGGEEFQMSNMSPKGRKEKSDVLFAWGASITAILNLCALVFFASSSNQQLPLMVVGLSQVITSIVAIWAWQKYLESSFVVK